MNVNLYIKGREADIGDKKTFARSFKKTMNFCDLENPTKITTDYSYSITLPGTDNNREIFGWIDQGTQPAYWNPNAAYPYSLNVNGILFSEGNVQLTEMKVSSGRVEFSCTFYSKVHSMIMDMSQKPLKDLTVLKDNESWKHFLNVSLMERIWTGYDPVSDMVRYVPTRAGMYPNFTSSKMMVPVWNASEPPSLTGYTGIDLGTDYDEYAMREYRLQFQRPAISVDRLVRGIASDFGVNVDASVMSTPYIRNSWLMCPSMSVEEKSDDCKGTFTQQTAGGTTTGQQEHYPQEPWYSSPVFIYDTNLGSMSQTSVLPSGDTIIYPSMIRPSENCLQVTIEFCLRVDYDMDFSISNTPYTMNPLQYQTGGSMNPTYTVCPSFVSMELSGSGHTVAPSSGEMRFEQGTRKYKVYGQNDWTIYNYSELHRVGGEGTSLYRTYWNNYTGNIFNNGWDDRTLIPCRFVFMLDHSVENVNLIPSLHFSDWAYYYTYAYGTGTNTQAAAEMLARIVPIESLTAQQINVLRNNGYNGYSISYTSTVTGASPMYVNMDTIFGSNELSCKDFLTDLTKMLGCIWEFDSQGGLTIESRNDYFSNYSIKDWTKKLDRSGYTIKPLVFDKREYTMGYKSGGSVLEDNYKDLTGQDYGKQYVDTGYPFNESTESLLETKFLNTVQCNGQRTVLFRNYQGELKYMENGRYEVPMIEKKDHGAPEEGFRLLFNNGVTELDKGEYVYLTQDSSFMYTEDIGGKCWMDMRYANDNTVPGISANTVQMNVIPFFCTRQNLASWDFAKSSVSYSLENDLSYPSEICLYPRFWRDYIGSLYDAKTRVMTGNFALSVEDLINFSFRDFVVIDNHIWHPNRLIDFDLSGESLTKVELVEVTDIEAWVSGQNWDMKNPPRNYGIQGGDRGASYWENYTEEEPEEE